MGMHLTGAKRQRMIDGIRAAIAVPFVDDIEDYIWEAIFSYSRGLPLIDPLSNIRSKLLFDVVDPKHKIGWSCKALQWPLTQGGEFELVIQRADIFKKAHTLGFKHLSKRSPCDLLGRALMLHWFGKVYADAEQQKVKDKRVAVLLKSDDRSKYAIHEDTIAEPDEKDLEWTWTDRSKTGLQGKRKRNGFCVYRWYPNQKQLFERFHLPPKVPFIEITPQRLPVKTVIDLLVSNLQGRR